LQAIYYKPFSYWDWHGVHPDDESAFEQKKQLIWERERGFTVGKYGKGGYPSPREAWLQFRALVDTHRERGDWVKRIAVASWMTVADMDWLVFFQLHLLKTRTDLSGSSPI
jgi:hypothetical protein